MLPTVFTIRDGGAEDAEPRAEEAAKIEAELGAETEADMAVADLETEAENPGNVSKECEVNLVTDSSSSRSEMTFIQ